MSIEAILLTARRITQSQYSEDWPDYFHRFVTSNVLIAASSISAYKTFSSSAIECMPPSNFPSSWIEVSLDGKEKGYCRPADAQHSNK